MEKTDKLLLILSPPLILYMLVGIIETTPAEVWEQAWRDVLFDTAVLAFMMAVGIPGVVMLEQSLRVIRRFRNRRRISHN